MKIKVIISIFLFAFSITFLSSCEGPVYYKYFIDNQLNEDIEFIYTDNNTLSDTTILLKKREQILISEFSQMHGTFSKGNWDDDIYTETDTLLQIIIYNKNYGQRKYWTLSNEKGNMNYSLIINKELLLIKPYRK